MANQQIAQRLLADLRNDFGLSQAQAAGVVGNLMHESGGFESLQEIKPTVAGSRGGFGYAQWTGPRRKAFEQWAAQKGLDPTSYEANYGFLAHEVTNDPYEREQFMKVRSAQSADEAAQIISKEYLRPGIPHMDARTRYARQLMGEDTGTAIASASPTASSAPAQAAPRNALGNGNALSATGLPITNALAAVGLATRPAPQWLAPPPVTFTPLELPARRRA